MYQYVRSIESIEILWHYNNVGHSFHHSNYSTLNAKDPLSHAMDAMDAMDAVDAMDAMDAMDSRGPQQCLHHLTGRASWPRPGSASVGSKVSQ